MENKTRIHNNKPPQPVLTAQNVLSEAETPENDPLNRLLPSFAMALNRAGRNVTEELLKTHIEKGPEHIKAHIRTLRKEFAGNVSSHIKNYEKIVEQFWQKDHKREMETNPRLTEPFISRIYKAIIKNDATNLPMLCHGANLYKQECIEENIDQRCAMLIENGADPSKVEAFKKSIIESEGYKDILLESIARLYRSFIPVAIHYGHVECLDILCQSGADLHYDETNENDDKTNEERFLSYCAGTGNTEMFSYLHKNHGLDIREHKDEVFKTIAASGNITMAEYMEKHGIPIAESENKDTIICQAILHGDTHFISYLHKNGFDLRENGDLACRLAAELGQIDIIESLEQDIVIPVMDILTEEEKEKLQKAKDNRTLWQNMHDLQPPKSRPFASPLGISRKTYIEIQDILTKENVHTDIQADAYPLARLFGTTDRVLSYMEKWTDLKYEPILPLDALADDFRDIPEEPFDRKAWGDAILRHGPKITELLPFAHKLPQPEKDDKGHWAFIKTRDAIALRVYDTDKTKEMPELAIECFKYGWEEEFFDEAYDLIQEYQQKYASNDNKKPGNHIPDIRIDGAEFGKPDYVFYKLPDGDMRGLFLGEYTDCCQHLTQEYGSPCAKHGFLSEYGGFYVLAHKETDEIVAQSWLWRGKRKELVFDSLETLGERVSADEWRRVLCKVSDILLVEQKEDIKRILIGKDKDTPKLDFNTVAILANPIDYNGYRDSEKEQYWAPPYPAIQGEIEMAKKFMRYRAKVFSPS